MNRKAKIVVEIYGNISPIFFWINEIKKVLSKDDKFKNDVFYKLLKEMRNTSSHLNIIDDKNIQQLFINMVLIYKKFGIYLIDMSEDVREIWNTLKIDCSSFKLGSSSIDYDNISISNNYTYQSHYDLLKNILTKFFVMSYQYNPENQYSPKENLIYKFASPIIIWNDIIKKGKGYDIKYSKLFILTNEIKNKLCHYSINKLSEILKSIVVIYQSFGLDLVKYNLEIKNNDLNTKLVGKFSENDINTDIRNIISEKSNKLRKYYFSFGTLLHHIVAVCVLKNKSILKMFINRKNDLEWNDYRESFVIRPLVFIETSFVAESKTLYELSTEGLELHFNDDLSNDSRPCDYLNKSRTKGLELPSNDANDSICVVILKTILIIFIIFVIFIILGSICFVNK